MKKHYFSQKRLLFWCQGIHLSFLEGLSRFEPLPLRLSGVRSNQLSYKPKKQLTPNKIIQEELSNQLNTSTSGGGVLPPILTKDTTERLKK